MQPSPARDISAERLHRLLAISTQLSSTLNLRELLQLVIDVTTELTDTEVASLLLLDEVTGELRFVASTTTPGYVLPDNVLVPLEGSIAGWIVLNGRPVISEDVSKDKRHYAGVDMSTQYVTRDLLGVPLASRKRVIGVLEAINKRNGSRYTDQDVRMMEALASQAAVAIENARLFQQSDLVAEIMHELKTPLMALTVSSDLLARNQLPETERRKLLNLIQRESSRLVQLSQNYLEFARLESHRVQIAREPVDMGALLHDVVGLEQARAAARQIEIAVILPGSVPAVEGDYDRLKQVFINLLSNAIKYNRVGGTVTMTVQATGRAARPELVVAVQDTGRGIAPEHLAHLFTRFYRVPDEEGFTEGTGLGLSIAQRIVEAHQGRIEVESSPGQGTTFTVRLPLTA